MPLLGIDLGTSEVKACLLDEEGQVLATATRPLPLQQPQPLWSEQDPHAWWEAADGCVQALRSDGHDLQGVRGIGIAGQMHGAVLLDAQRRALRPAILWNDGRSGAECSELEARVPTLHALTGNLAMPGFTAPKLLWVRRHEPAVFAALRLVLLPKDWLVLRLTGQASTDMSDASGTLWLDVARRRWSEEMLQACGLTLGQVPSLHEGTQAVGTVLPEVAQRWGLARECVVAAGAGDNAGAAVGLGCTEVGSGFVSIGTSGVAFLVSDGYRPEPARAVHAFCHAVPRRWHQMGVMLSAAASLNWAAAALRLGSAAHLLAQSESVTPRRAAHAPLFLPYLAGERTPHNDVGASGVFFGLRAAHEPADLAHAVAEGVCFGLADCLAAVDAARTARSGLHAVGGAARNERLLVLLASAAGLPLQAVDNAQHAAARGAGLLAQAAARGGGLAPIAPLRAAATVAPDPAWAAVLAPRLHAFRELYRSLREPFQRSMTQETPA